MDRSSKTRKSPRIWNLAYDEQGLEGGGAGSTRVATLLPIMRYMMIIVLLSIAGMIAMSRLGFDIGFADRLDPHIAKIDLYQTSGHWGTYRDNMYAPIEVDGEEFILKPMNCPHHIEIYKSEMRSYKDLPLRLAEFGQVYRYEQSGNLSGLTRVRGFTVDDSTFVHITHDCRG